MRKESRSKTCQTETRSSRRVTTRKTSHILGRVLDQFRRIPLPIERKASTDGWPNREDDSSYRRDSTHGRRLRSPNWSRSRVCFAVNNSVAQSTGYSPFFLAYGRKRLLPIDVMCKDLRARPDHLCLRRRLSSQLEFGTYTVTRVNGCV